MCGRSPQFEDVCRAPVLGKKEHGRDYAWEAVNVCPAFEPIEGHPTLGTCYVYAGVQDSRQVYRRVARRRTP